MIAALRYGRNSIGIDVDPEYCRMAAERQARKRLMVLHAAPSLEALMLNPGNRFHALKGDRKGQYAISINNQWRVCFEWHDGDAYNVEITDYH